MASCKYYGDVINCEGYKPFTAEVRATRNFTSPTFFTVPKRQRFGCIPWKASKTKSVELRAGFLHKGCDCVKYNGLQDACERWGCIDNPCCTTMPRPSCTPGRIMLEPQKDCSTVKNELFTREQCCRFDKPIQKCESFMKLDKPSEKCETHAKCITHAKCETHSRCEPYPRCEATTKCEEFTTCRHSAANTWAPETFILTPSYFGELIVSPNIRITIQRIS